MNLLSGPRRQFFRPGQSSNQQKRVAGVWLVFALLALALAACSPGGVTTTSGGSPQSTQPPAPIHVPHNFQGFIVVTFSATVTYQQASDILTQAGLKLAVPCPNPGPIVDNVTPKPTDQTSIFAETHKLTARGDPLLTQDKLNQVASSAGVTSVDSMPLIECPL